MAFDFATVSAPFRMQPGLRRVAAGDRQLTASAPNGRHLREKMAVLTSFPHQALLSVTDFDPRPALRAIAGDAAGASPCAFELDEKAPDRLRCHAPLLGCSVVDGVPLGGGDPAIGELLRRLPRHQRETALACLAFEEDFAILDGATATVPWLAVCLPSRWAPEDKVGRHFAAIHAPVADNAVLLAAGESLARLVTGGERWERFVWTIAADPRLHQHPARSDTAWPRDLDADALAARASFRNERQTFIPIAGAAQAVFTIRVASVPLATAVASDGAAARLHAALASMSAEVLAYKGLDSARERLLAWLGARRAAPPTAPP
jgi:dimethylamine monooxygenase subunit A